MVVVVNAEPAVASLRKLEQAATEAAEVLGALMDKLEALEAKGFSVFEQETDPLDS
jgi:hypothetical protein